MQIYIDGDPARFRSRKERQDRNEKRSMAPQLPMKAAKHLPGRDTDVNRDTPAILLIAHRLISSRFWSAFKRRQKGFWRGLLTAIAVLPGALGAQPSQEGPSQRLRAIQNIFDPLSKPAELLNDTARLVLLICLIIFLVVGGLLLYSVWRYRRKAGDDDTEEPSQVYGSNAIELAWTIPPILIVIVLVLITARTVGEIQNVQFPKDVLQLRVIGHRFWWELQYPGYGVTAANEIHVPVSYLPSTPRPVEMILDSADVVHGFWVPQLAGKSWVVPNHRNIMWIQPSSLGTYPGNCTVYCGEQHANMLIRVIVESPEDFEQWIAGQKAPAVADPSVEDGRKEFIENSCGTCHRIAGTSASGVFGPDLTHYMSRQTLGSGVALNNDENLLSWLRDPQVLKPGCRMPNMKLDDKEVDLILAYLKTLK
jgi:cytochrome c oxidase subunit 2